MRAKLPVSVRRGLLVLGALVFMFALNEGLARSINTSFDLDNFDLAGAGNDRECTRPSMSRGYEPTPGKCGVNEHGARVERFPTAPGDAPVRVMLVGDSISAQLGLPQLLAQGLSREWSGRAVEVQAFAAAGYNTCQELSMYLERVEVARPDFVVLQTCPNDVVGSPVLLRVGSQVRYFVDDTYVEFPAWVTHSRFLTLAVLSFGERQPHGLITAGPGFVKRCLADLRAAVGSRGIPLATVFFPLFWTESEAPEGMLADEVAMRRLVSESGIPMVDLRPVYEAAGPVTGFRSHPGDFIHPNAQGQQLAAEATARFIGATFLEPATR